MNKSIKKELEGLFIEWHNRMKATDSTSHFTRDGLMYNSIPNEPQIRNRPHKMTQRSKR